MKKNNLSFILFFIGILLAVSIFYFPTIFYAVKAFDEITPFKETHLPTCFSLSEIFELISLLGLHHYFEASNTLYSSIVSIRSNPLGDFFVLLVQFFCRKNPINYHLYSLILHLTSTAFVFLILNKISLDFSSKINNLIRLITISLLAFLWATHPVNIESVLLLTNYNAIFSYCLCIVIIFIYLNVKSESIPGSVVLFLIFSIAVFTAEYLFMLPIVLLSYIFATTKNFKYSLKQTLPLFLVSILFVLSFLFSTSRINLETQSSFLLTIERIFWLSPQILFHLIKLLIFPIKLSIDQTFLVKIGDSIFSLYSTFCIFIIFFALVYSLKSLFDSKKKCPFFFIFFIPFFISLIPFSHILATIYNLASERYLYLPSFIFIFGLSHLIFYTLNKYEDQNKIIYSLILFLTIITSIYSTRAFIRTLDWKDSFTLYNSAIHATNNPLYKAFRLKGLVSNEKLFSQYPEREVDLKFQNLAIHNLNKSIKYYKKRIRTIQSSIPKVVKNYGLDPKTLLAKSGYILAQCDFNLNSDPKSALNIIQPYTKDLSILDGPALAFYASLLYYNNMPNQALYVLKRGYKLRPYSTRIILSLCDLIYIKYGDLKTIEDYCLKAFKYFPYDSYTIYALANTYRLMNNHKRYAYFSYLYGLRNHSIEALKTAYNEYLFLNDKNNAQKVMNKISFIERELQKRNEKK